jgi:hypothetical protein
MNSALLPKFRLCLFTCLVVLALETREGVARARQQPAAPAAGQLSQAEKAQRVNDLLKEADETDDLLLKKQKYLEALDIDRSNPVIRQLVADNQLKIDELAKNLGNETASAMLRSRIEDALRTKDDQKLADVKHDLETALKTDQENKEWLGKLKAIDDQIKANGLAAKSKTAKGNAQNALDKNDRKLLKAALTDVNENLKANPNDAELQRLASELEARSRQADTVWWLKVIALVVLIVALIVGVLYLLLRKRKGLLQFADGDRAGELFVLEGPKATVGALPENQLHVADETGKVSRCHCEIFKEGRRYFINDTSRNGTWLNDHRLEPGRPKVLRKGDQISLAGQVTLVFRLK